MSTKQTKDAKPSLKTPFGNVKETFGDKAKLVAAVEKLANEDLWLGRTNANKGLAHVSNSKLLRLHATFTTVKEKFGTRVKLIDAICDLEKRAKDEGYKSRLGAFPVPRLWDLYRSAERRNANATEKGAPKVEKAAPKKAAKAAAPKAEKAAPKKAASATAKKSTKK